MPSSINLLAIMIIHIFLFLAMIFITYLKRDVFRTCLGHCNCCLSYQRQCFKCRPTFPKCRPTFRFQALTATTSPPAFEMAFWKMLADISGKIRYVADILGKIQYVDCSWKLEQLRNFNNGLVNIYKMFKLRITILNIFM